MKLGGTDIAVIDLETTGLWPGWRDRIVEIGIVGAKGGRKSGEFLAVLEPTRPVGRRAEVVHGISRSVASFGPRFEDVAEVIAQMLDGRLIVGHRVMFDVGFLAAELDRVGLHVRPAGLVDTHAVARRLWPEMGFYSLGRLAEVLRIGRKNGHHRAIEDARLTWRLFRLQVEALGGWGLGLSDLSRFVGYRLEWPDPRPWRSRMRLYAAVCHGRRLKANGGGGGQEVLLKPIQVKAVNGRAVVVGRCEGQRVVRVPAAKVSVA